MTYNTQAKKDKDERTAYVAMDAIQRLCDRGNFRGSLNIDKSFTAIRSVINDIKAATVRSGK